MKNLYATKKVRLQAEFEEALLHGLLPMIARKRAN